MLEDNVLKFLAGDLMIIAATRDPDMRAHIARGTGIRFNSASGQLELLVSASQWAEAVRHAVPGAPIAATCANPVNYVTYQIKGRISAVSPADAEEQQRANTYVETMAALLGRLGVSRVQLSSTLVSHYPVRISFWPTELFVQTPGPQAGSRV